MSNWKRVIYILLGLLIMSIFYPPFIILAGIMLAAYFIINYARRR